MTYSTILLCAVTGLQLHGEKLLFYAPPEQSETFYKHFPINKGISLSKTDNELIDTMIEDDIRVMRIKPGNFSFFFNTIFTSFFSVLCFKNQSVHKFGDALDVPYLPLPSTVILIFFYSAYAYVRIYPL
jgi:hypothetical protein